MGLMAGRQAGRQNAGRFADHIISTFIVFLMKIQFNEGTGLLWYCQCISVSQVANGYSCKPCYGGV